MYKITMRRRLDYAMRGDRPVPRLDEVLIGLVCWARGCLFPEENFTQFCSRCGRFMP